MRPAPARGSLQLDIDWPEGVVEVRVGGGVGDGVEVGALLRGAGDGLGEAVGVDKGVAAGLACAMVEHGGVFGGGLLAESLHGGHGTAGPEEFLPLLEASKVGLLKRPRASMG